MSVSLHCTKNYGLFELCDFNRDLHKLSGLCDSMKEHGFIQAYPLHVVRNGNGKLKIKAGHHRFEAAKSLGIGVYYVICDDTASVFQLEYSGPGHWKFMDFFNGYLRKGEAPYEAVKDFSERTGIGLAQSAALLANESGSSGNQNKHIKAGTYEVKDTAHAEKVAVAIIGCRNLKIPFATLTNFVSAVGSMCRLDEFDVETFLRRIEVNPSMMRKQATMAQYQEMIEAVYNHKAQYKAPLAFMARDAARNRAAVKRPEGTEPTP
jgi:hypothetical protein